jgi:hypothetical protein
MLGFNSLTDAKKAYCGSMPSKWFMSIKEVTWDEFQTTLSKSKKSIKKASASEDCGLLKRNELIRIGRSHNAPFNDDTHSSINGPLKNAIKDIEKSIDKTNSIPRLVIRM